MDALRKMSLACGNAVSIVSPEGVVVSRRGGAKFLAVEPRPCKMINVCWCSRRGEIITGSGNCPGTSFAREARGGLSGTGEAFPGSEGWPVVWPKRACSP